MGTVPYKDAVEDGLIFDPLGRSLELPPVTWLGGSLSWANRDPFVEPAPDGGGFPSSPWVKRNLNFFAERHKRVLLLPYPFANGGVRVPIRRVRSACSLWNAEEMQEYSFHLDGYDGVTLNDLFLAGSRLEYASWTAALLTVFSWDVPRIQAEAAMNLLALEPPGVSYFL